MKVWIQAHKGERPASKNFFEAMCGFEELGAEIRFFHNPLEMRQAEPEDILVGYVEAVQQHLEEMGFSYPDLDYPAELEYCLGRKIWKSTINTINFHPEQWPVFVKSIADKEITGVLVRSPRDLVALLYPLWKNPGCKALSGNLGENTGSGSHQKGRTGLQNRASRLFFGFWCDGYGQNSAH